MTDSDNRVGVWPVALVWVLTAAAYAARAISNAATTPLLLDTDDAMRLTEVRDFLGGQNLFDIVQHRLNPPYGAEMHWSRLIDLPEATILLLLRPFLGPLAETVTAYVWPLLLLAAFLGQYVSMALWMAGYKYTEASVAAVLNETASVFIVLLAALFLGEGLDARRLVGVTCTLSGVACMLAA